MHSWPHYINFAPELSIVINLVFFGLRFGLKFRLSYRPQGRKSSDLAPLKALLPIDQPYTTFPILANPCMGSLGRAQAANWESSLLPMTTCHFLATQVTGRCVIRACSNCWIPSRATHLTALRESQVCSRKSPLGHRGLRCPHGFVCPPRNQPDSSYGRHCHAPSNTVASIRVAAYLHARKPVRRDNRDTPNYPRPRNRAAMLLSQEQVSGSPKISLSSEVV